MNKWQCKAGEGVARKLAAAAALKQIRIVCHKIISHPFELRRSVFRHCYTSVFVAAHCVACRFRLKSAP